MRIGIDARFIGPQGTGLGKYTEKLITNLAKIDKRNTYIIFLKKDNWHFLKIEAKNFHKRLADVKWYSIFEQIKLPGIFVKEKLDLLHIPHFNVPLFYKPPGLSLGNIFGLHERSEFKGKFVVTIHDLIHHHFSETSTTAKNLIVFKLKRIAYKFVISSAVKRSSKILVPSNFVKDEIIKYYKISPPKIIVTYEAAEEEYFVNRQRSSVKGQVSLLYVGNAYPHKNLPRLLDAFKILTTHYSLPATHLVLVCPRDIFWQRLEGEIKARNLEGKVRLIGYMRVGELAKLFANASTYVFPSLSEGFGIPGLNAMAAGLPVVCSDIPVLHEVYGEAAIYFNPHDPKDIAKKIKKALTDNQFREKLIDSGYKQVNKFSWQRMARETLKVYESV